jgi:hypothetical protein
MKISKKILALAALGVIAASGPSNALQINAVFDTSWTSSAPAAATATVNYVDAMLGSMFTNKATVNIDFGWNEVGGQAISGNTAGATITNFAATYQLSSFANVLSAYSAANPQNTVMAGLLKTLPSTISNSNPNGSNWLFVPSAEYAALTGSNWVYPNADVGFGGSVPWQYSTTQGSAGAYDFVGAALHEITHALGRVDFEFVSGGTPYLTPYDLVRYNCGSTTLNSTQASPACFSIDGGVTDLATFSPTSDSGDWANTAAPGVPPMITSPNKAYISTGDITPALLPTDILAMEALGYTRAGTGNVPEPATLLLFLPFAGILIARRRCDRASVV